MQEDKYKLFKDILMNSKSVVFFTGAGISTASGIPDFRSAKGIYSEKFKELSPETIISHSFFMNYPKEFYDFYRSKMIFENAKPNDAHKYIAELEKSVKNVYVVTQNIDGLHSLAGSLNVCEIHGTVFKNHCQKCQTFYTLEGLLNSFKDGIPTCSKCGGVIKPDVVLYEEQLNYSDMDKAIDWISHCDTLVVIGTSLIVYPAASFVRYFNGKHLILINKTPTSYDRYCEMVFNEDIVEFVKKVKSV